MSRFSFILCLLALCLIGCGPAQEQPHVAYVIPEADKPKAAQMVVDLMKVNHGSSYSPDVYLDAAWATALRVYGKPVDISQSYSHSP